MKEHKPILEFMLSILKFIGYALAYAIYIGFFLIIPKVWEWINNNAEGGLKTFLFILLVLGVILLISSQQTRYSTKTTVLGRFLTTILYLVVTIGVGLLVLVIAT